MTLEDGMVKVSVDDTVIGISAQSKPLLFKQFAKVQSMAVGSTGLGLYSLRKRVDAIGGTCGVTDRVDGQQGSTFWFSFPFRPDITEECEKAPSHDQEDSDRSLDIHNLNILIVDDSVSVTKILSNKLRHAGYTVTTACNGAEGLAIMLSAASKLDVVFMDLQMPVMDGIEATKRLRDHELLVGLGNHLPIICSSANSKGEAEELAINAGVDYFLPKPFTTAVLFGLLNDIKKGKFS